jgi:hypothetical protein
MKKKFIPFGFTLILAALMLLSSCTQTTLPAELPQMLPTLATFELPIELVFDTTSGLLPSLLGADITYLGSAPAGNVYQGARDELANLVVFRYGGMDYFYSLKGFDINTLQQVICNVDCDLAVGLVEGTDLLIEVNSLNLTQPLSEPQVEWDRATLEPVETTGCEYLSFAEGSYAVVQLPLKMRSNAEIPQDNFNSNVISYLSPGEEALVLEDSQDAWVYLQRADGISGYSKQCSTIDGRFLLPK